MTFFLDYIRKITGWCPAKSGNVSMNTIHGYRAKTGHFPGSPDKVIEGRIVDYASTGRSSFYLILFIAAVTAFVLLTVLAYIMAPILAGSIVCCLLLFYSIILVAGDIKKASLEYGHDSIIIRRPLLRAVVIRKEEIANTEIRDKNQPLPHWLVVMMLIVLPVLMSANIYGRYLDWISAEVSTALFLVYSIYYVCMLIFFISILNHSHVRHHYPKTLNITTTGNKILVIYTKNPDELTEIKEELV